MQGSHRSTGLLRSVLTNGWRRWLLGAGLLATGVVLVSFSSALVLSAKHGGVAPTSAAALEAEAQGEAQPTPVTQNVEQDEDDTLAVGQAFAQVDGETQRSGLAQLAQVLGPTPTPTPKPEPKKPVGQPKQVEASQAEPEPPAQQVQAPQAEPQAPAQQVEAPQAEPEAPAQQVQAPQEEPVAPPAAPEEPASPPQEPPAPSCPTASMSGFALALFNAINNERIQRGLPALAAHGCVVHVAQLRSADMAARSYFSHTSPDGETAFSLMDQYGVLYGWAGENIATNNHPDDATIAVAMRTLMESEPHRANILNGDFTHVGVGAAVDVSGTKYFTMVFISQP